MITKEKRKREKGKGKKKPNPCLPHLGIEELKDEPARPYVFRCSQPILEFRVMMLKMGFRKDIITRVVDFLLLRMREVASLT